MDRSSATFLAITIPDVIEKDAPHHMRRDREKVRPVLPHNMSLTIETDVRFVDNRGGLHCIAGAKVVDVPAGDLTELALDQWVNVIQGIVVPARPFD